MIFVILKTETKYYFRNQKFNLIELQYCVRVYFNLKNSQEVQALALHARRGGCLGVHTHAVGPRRHIEEIPLTHASCQGWERDCPPSPSPETQHLSVERDVARQHGPVAGGEYEF